MVYNNTVWWFCRVYSWV